MAEEAPGMQSLPRRLASVDKKVRDRAVDLLESWLVCHESVSQEELKKIWKGLFYCYWHTDKAHVQAELAERLSSLLLSLPAELGVKFFEEFLGTMRREWGGIDQLRMDKFYVLQRKFINGMFRTLKVKAWEKELVAKYMDGLKRRNLVTEDLFPALGSSMHIAEIFLDELGPLFPDDVGVFELMLEPFYSVLALSKDKGLVKRVKESFFYPLLRKLDVVVKNGEEDRIGEAVLRLPVEKKLFEFASAAETVQGNRKVLYSLYEEFKRLKKNAEDKNDAAAVMKKPESGKKQKKKAAKTPPPKSSEKDTLAEGMVVDTVGQDDTVVSNLETKFQVVAPEEHDVGSLPPLEMVLSPLIGGRRRRAEKKRKKSSLSRDDTPITSPDPESSPSDSSLRKRKRDRTAFQVPVSPLNTASKKRKSSKDSPDAAENGGESANSSRKKKVRFALKRNTVWNPTSPRSALSVMSPSSKTPKCSALKPGLAPGPIRTVTPRRVSPRKNQFSLKRA